MMTLRTAFLTLHVLGGVTGLLLGAFALHPPEPRNYRLALRRAYAAAIALLVVFLVATVVLDWWRIDTMQRIVFSVLIGLAAVIAARVYLAFEMTRKRRDGWQVSYMNHIYFTYISLWEGFFIVGLFDLNAPAWLIGLVAVGVLVLGAILFSRYKRQQAPRPAPA
jgi:hypothetical protein